MVNNKTVNQPIINQQVTRVKRFLSIAFIAGTCAMPVTTNAVLYEQHLKVGTEQQGFSQAELAQMLAPIALYPDTLLTHILIAATYPIEVIDADRFLKKNEHKSLEKIQRKAEKKDWDPSVKALLAFPNVIEKLSTDLTWMRELGDAFLQNEERVLASIQTLRQQADQAGNLSQMDNVQIIREKQTIVIQPQRPEVVYVPYYDTRVVYGDWYWHRYPPVYWHRPAHYSYYHGPFYWRSGVHLALDFFFVGFHWRNHHVVHHHPKKYIHRHNRMRLSTSNSVKRWAHNAKRRKGVAYRSPAIKKRYASYRPSVARTKVIRHHNKHDKRLFNSRNRNANHVAKTPHNRFEKKLKENRHAQVKQYQHSKKTGRHHYKTETNNHKKGVVNNRQVNRQVSITSKKQPVKVRAPKSKQSYDKSLQQRAKHTNTPLPKHVKTKSLKVKETKQYRRSNNSSKTHSAKGGHSRKYTARVAKDSSSKRSAHPSSRQKRRD